VFPAGEGGSAEKVEWVQGLLQDEEKVDMSRASATSNLGSYSCALAFLLPRQSQSTAPCMHATSEHEILDLVQESFDH